MIRDRYVARDAHVIPTFGRRTPAQTAALLFVWEARLIARKGTTLEGERVVLSPGTSAELLRLADLGIDKLRREGVVR